ncbi:MAG: hypothetical protein WD077_16280 [Bacteroidia bacterium]
MFKRNHVVFGLLISIVLTMATFALLFALNFYISRVLLDRNPILSFNILLIFSIAINFLPLNYYTKVRAFNTAKGVMAGVFLFALFYVYRTFFI